MTRKKKKNKKKSIFKSIGKGLLSGVKSVDTIAQNVALAGERMNLQIGEKVTITNGIYKGESLIFHNPLSGGIQGQINSGQIVNIRHGSYKK